MRHMYYVCGASAADIVRIKTEQIEMTHLIYSFFFASSSGYLTSRPARNPGAEGDCKEMDFYYIDSRAKEVLLAMRELKKKNPGLKVIVAVGGGWAPPDPEINQQMIVSRIMRDDGLRARFVSGLKALTWEYDLDGIDIDYEHPQSEEDVFYLSKLARDIRNAFEELDAATTDRHREISMAVNGVEQQAIYYSSELDSLRELVDNWNIMNYDYDYGKPGTIYLVAPMHSKKPPKGGEIISSLVGKNSKQEQFGMGSTMEGIMAYVNRGFPKERMNLGVPFYGRHITFKDIVLDIVFGVTQFDTKEDIAYRDIPADAINGINGWEKIYNPHADNYYSVRRNARGHIVEAYTYDDVKCLKAKRAYAESVGLGGMMVWQLGQDTDDNDLGKAVI